VYRCAQFILILNKVLHGPKEVLIMAENKLTINPKKYKGETSTITTRLPAELIEKIDETVKITGRTRNDIVQRFIEYAVENLEIGEE
jgi:hypothetical protein